MSLSQNSNWKFEKQHTKNSLYQTCLYTHTLAVEPHQQTNPLFIFVELLQMLPAVRVCCKAMADKIVFKPENEMMSSNSKHNDINFSNMHTC